MTFWPAKAFDFRHRHALDADRMESVFHIIQPGTFYYSLYHMLPYYKNENYTISCRYE